MSELLHIEEMFLGALEKSDPAERAAFLAEQCRGNVELQRHVERLLRANERAQGFLEGPLQEASRTIDLRPATEGAGSLIAGRYKLLEPIGEGGMGTVWMAQQTEPVKRTVALKLIKAGMDTKAVLARFEAERQALALMDHPNIAKVLDAGATDEGRPYFVMELVKGVPITRYCDERKLPLPERLDLFVSVCQAVQHAHQKGVIHRDLKPSNVLVARYDDHPVPKVIDFGIAKAAGQPLTDRTLVTGFGAVVGTPEYMSPEQAQFNQLDIDTRSDIYALGVLLYELLTGSTPVTRRDLEKAGLLEVLRMIREQEPPRPSTRLGSATTLPEIAAARASEPKALAALIRNDLDWIVMKALEKDRNRRYETATGLATDIKRYLNGEAVQAHPPSASYRFRKAFRKNKVAIATVAAFMGLLIAATGVSIRLALKAWRAEAEARQNAEKATHSQGIAAGLNMSLVEALDESKLTAASLQVDADLAEIKADRKTGLLRLVRTLKGLNPVGQTVMPSDDLGRHRRELREFVTMASLAHGQALATLLPPFSHDERAIARLFTCAHVPRVLTAGVDRTARLWDISSGRQIAILRRNDELVLGAGFSPDGSTAFTDCSDGVVRFWETTDGAFRAQTDARPERLKGINLAEFDSFNENQFTVERMTQISDKRALTSEKSWRNPNIAPATSDPRSKSPVELWDTKTGRLIARLELPWDDAFYRFVGDGRWIEGRENEERGHSLHIFSAEHGRPIAELNHDAPYESPYFGTVSPSGHTATTICSKKSLDRAGSNSIESDMQCYVHLWDAITWTRLSTSGPFEVKGYGFAGARLITDELFELCASTGPPKTLIIRARSSASLAVLDDVIVLVDSNQGIALGQSGHIIDTKSWQRVPSPKGRVHQPELAKVAPDGRFVFLRGTNEFVFAQEMIDSKTDKAFDVPRFEGVKWVEPPIYLPRVGWSIDCEDNGVHWVQRLPPPDHLNIPPDLLELWTQVVVRGELDDNGAFLKWDEPTWEMKRQELAAKPAPYRDFPFPGHVATDKLHWLRAELENASEAEKPRLAKQFVDRAESALDRAEAAPWRELLNRPK